MNLKTAVFSLLLLVAFLPAKAETVFQEDFDHYGVNVENFNPGVRVAEEPGSIKRLRLSPKENSYVKALKNPYLIPKDLRGDDVEYSFIFRPLSADVAKSFEAHLLFAAKPDDSVKNFKTVTIRLNSDNGSTLEGALEKSDIGPLALTKQLANLAPFCNYQWYKVRVRIINRNITLYVERETERVECRGKLPAGYRLAALNFAGRSPFDVDELKVVRLPAEMDTTTVTYSKPIEKEVSFAVSDIGYPGAIVFKFSDGTEKPIVCTMRSFAQRDERMVVKTVPETKDGKTVNVRKIVPEDVLLEDSGLRFTCGNFSKSMYTVPLLYDRFESWQKRPIIKSVLDGKADFAGSHRWNFRLVRADSKVQLWVDGNYLFDLPLKGELQPAWTVEVPHGAKIEFTRKRLTEQTMMDAIREKDPLSLRVENIPADGFDTGVCKEFLGTYALECDGYLSRTAFDASPDCLLRSVPCAQYIKVVAVCSLGKNDSEKSTDVTARITRYISGSCSGRTPRALADCTITLPRSEKDICPKNVQRIAGGKFLVTFDIPAGKIQDIYFMENNTFVDFEMLGGLWEKNNYYISREGKPSLTPSNVIVHKAWLVKSPVSMMVENGGIANVFYPDQEAFVTAKLTALLPGKYKVVWTIRDIDGKILETSENPISFKKAGETLDVKKTFKQREYGHYTFNAKLLDGNGAELVSYDGSFSLIAQDTRKAGYESPYATWNFAGSHGTPKDPKVFGPMFKMMGVRRSWGWPDEASVPKEYGPITYPHFSNLRAKGNTPEEREKSLETQIKDLTKRYPHVKTAMIFHESCGGALPQELLGGKTEVTEKVLAQQKKTVERALELANAWRKYAPQIQLVIGNTGVSIGCAGNLFREKYPADKIDFLGEESVGMTLPPERSVAGPSWMLRQMALMYGYDKVQPNACYEWKDRMERDCNSDRICAAYRVRDILVAHAWHYNLIPVGGVAEIANSYYNTIWGPGNCSRWPLLQPYPAMTAVCVATQVLDCVQATRLVPTGSHTVYMLEFKRGSEFVYACWTPRGEVSVKLDFNGAKVTHTGFYGKVSEWQGGELTFTEEPCYLISKSPVKSAVAALERKYPWEVYGMRDAKVVCPMDSAAAWKLVEGEDKRIQMVDDEIFVASYQPGKFKVADVQDGQRGNCLEITLVPEGKCADLVREYAFIRMNQPAAIAGTPSTLGLWVKGNSCWGKLFFEIEDADGEIWVSAGTGGYGCPVYDWCEQMAINFDGWHFVQFPLTGKSPVKIHSPGDNQWQWQSDRSGDGKLTFPIKLRGIGFALARKVLNIDKMDDVKDLSVRFKDFSAY